MSKTRALCRSFLPAAVAVLVGFGLTISSAWPCELQLVVPIYDGQTWTGGCNARINGVVVSEPGCPGVVRIHWDWGDGDSDDQWFPAAHTYSKSGIYDVTVTPYDAAGGSTSRTIQLPLSTCDPLGPADPILYRTDFQSFGIGNVNGQDGWIVGNLSCPGCPYDVPTSPDGMVVDTGSGQKALEVRAAPGWGWEVGRFYVPSTARFVGITLDFQTRGAGGPFWFMDNKQHGQPALEAIYLWRGWVRSDATPGIGGAPHAANAWHRTGIEVDQQTGRIVAFFVDGAWRPDDDSAGTFGAAKHDLFYFRGVGAGERLWIDNLSITESGAPQSARAATRELEATNASLPVEAFQNENLKHAMNSKIQAVLELIAGGAFTEAADKLLHDILKKTDGCANLGAPDSNDWVTDCASQEELRPKVEAAIEMVGRIE